MKLGTSAESLYALQPKAVMPSSFMLPCMDWAALRREFRKQRESRVGSRAKLVERIGEAGAADDDLDESTVYRFETDAKYYPRLSTFVRLVEGMGLTVPEFFGGLANKPAKVGPPDVRLLAAFNDAKTVADVREALEMALGALPGGSQTTATASGRKRGRLQTAGTRPAPARRR